MTELLEVHGLSRSFGSLRAVQDSSFVLRRHEVLAIIGPNGSGKSTTINLLSGELAPDSGRILLRGEDLAGRSPDQVARAGVKRTFQNGRVFGNSTVETNVLLGQVPLMRAGLPLGRLRPVPVLRWLALALELVVAVLRPRSVREEHDELQERVTSQLSRFHDRLTPRRTHAAATLSYANRRRTEIARALASDPELLLLDEPTAGMNPVETDEVMHQLLELKAQGQTMLLVEHKLDLVMAVSDRILVMDEGRIIAEGTPAQVQRDERVIEAYLGRSRTEQPAGPDGATTQGATERATERATVTRTAAPAAGDPLLDVRGLDVWYGQFHALRDVSYTVGEGEIVSLLGGNASGKSTSMKAVLRVVDPRGGDVLFRGRSTLRDSTADVVRQGIASVPEARRVFPELTVEENLLVGGWTHSGGRAALRAQLAQQYDLFPRLHERRAQRAGTLSGGEQQMLAFGRALMSQPRLLCMDEPTMGLAPIVVDQVLDTIQRINRDLGVAVFMVEQNAVLALSVAHRGYVLVNGAVRLSGPAAELLADPEVREAYLGQVAEPDGS